MTRWRWREAGFAATALLLAACNGDGTVSAATSSASIAPSADPAPSAATASAVGSADPIAAGNFENEDLPDLDVEPKTLEEQRLEMLKRMQAMGTIDDGQAQKILAILDGSKFAGQGNPAVTIHPMSRAECFARRRAAGVRDEKKPLCKAPFMVPIYDPETEREDQAKVCIDRYEFPDLPCEYPATWITTNKAEEICKVEGKRLCDAHEWEGACAGAVYPPEKEYAFGLPRDTMRGVHNIHRKIVWAYGPKKDQTKCGTSSRKSKECVQTGWDCGSNTFPAGSFPECKSSFGVYDQHGNAAEHMLLPLHKEDLGANGGFGEPEMKGSWFIFQWYEAHEDDCRWRAPSWHDDEGKNHMNYHLGFRCCKDVR